MVDAKIGDTVWAACGGEGQEVVVLDIPGNAETYRLAKYEHNSELRRCRVARTGAEIVVTRRELFDSETAAAFASDHGGLDTFMYETIMPKSGTEAA